MASCPEQRVEIHVAAGVLRDPHDRVLVTQRPTGKPQAGAWEFPGGKLAQGETPLAGLARELREELGIEVRIARHLTRYSHDYAERRVHLYVWLVTAWGGTPTGREGQPLQWLEPAELMGRGLLPADEHIAELLQAESAVNRLSAEVVLREPVAG